jgi:hypothetical protein
MMNSNDYHFVTVWYVKSTLEEVTEILDDAQGLARWWPSVYLDVKVLTPGDAAGVGRVIDLYTKGWLPYTLRWQFTIAESHPPHGFTLEATGDFVGRGIWTFETEGDQIKITYDWAIRANKLLLRTFSWLMKPIFSANHHWAMAQGETSLKLELERRHSPSPEARARVAPPPPPTPSSPLKFLVSMFQRAS